MEAEEDNDSFIYRSEMSVFVDTLWHLWAAFSSASGGICSPELSAVFVPKKLLLKLKSPGISHKKYEFPTNLKTGISRRK